MSSQETAPWTKGTIQECDICYGNDIEHSEAPAFPIFSRCCGCGAEVTYSDGKGGVEWTSQRQVAIGRDRLQAMQEDADRAEWERLGSDYY